MPTDYHFAQHLLVRALGALVAGTGLVLVVVTVLVAALDLPGAVVTAAVVVVTVAVVTAAVLLARFRTLVRLDDTGYQVRALRGAGVKQARWREVEDLVTATVAGHECVVLRLKDGRTTTVPVDVLDVDPSSFVRQLTAYLDAGHGYRRLS